MLCTNPKTSFLHVSITLEKTEWSFIDTQMVEYKDKVLIKKKVTFIEKNLRKSGPLLFGEYSVRVFRVH